MTSEEKVLGTEMVTTLGAINSPSEQRKREGKAS